MTASSKARAIHVASEQGMDEYDLADFAQRCRLDRGNSAVAHFRKLGWCRQDQEAAYAVPHPAATANLATLMDGVWVPSATTQSAAA